MSESQGKARKAAQFSTGERHRTDLRCGWSENAQQHPWSSKLRAQFLMKPWALRKPASILWNGRVHDLFHNSLRNPLLRDIVDTWTLWRSNHLKIIVDGDNAEGFFVTRSRTRCDTVVPLITRHWCSNLAGVDVTFYDAGKNCREIAGFSTGRKN